LVEAVGIEPTSEKRVSKASTCIAFFFLLSPLHRRRRQPVKGPALLKFLRLRHKADRNPRSTIVVAPPEAVDQAAGRHVAVN